MSDFDALVKGLAEYDAGWRDCLNSLRRVPAEHMSMVIDHLLREFDRKAQGCCHATETL